MYRRSVMANLEGRSVRRSLAWDGLRAFEAVYQPHTALAMHEHSAPFFTYVLRGEFVERTARMDRDCPRGWVIFHPPCDAHANAVGPRGTMSLNVEISPELWAELAGVSGQVLSGDVEWLPPPRCGGNSIATMLPRNSGWTKPWHCCAHPCETIGSPLGPFRHGGSPSAPSTSASTSRRRRGWPKSRTSPASIPCTSPGCFANATDTRWASSCAAGASRGPAASSRARSRASPRSASPPALPTRPIFPARFAV